MKSYNEINYEDDDYRNGTSIVVDLPMPKHTFACHFLEEDPDDNSLWGYLTNKNCVGLLDEGCKIKDCVYFR